MTLVNKFCQNFVGMNSDFNYISSSYNPVIVNINKRVYNYKKSPAYKWLTEVFGSKLYFKNIKVFCSCLAVMIESNTASEMLNDRYSIILWLEKNLEEISAYLQKHTLTLCTVDGNMINVFPPHIEVKKTLS